MSETTLTREEMFDVAKAANAMAELYGMVPAEQAYYTYRTWFDHGTSVADFADIVASAAHSGKFSFRVWSTTDCDFIIHESLDENDEGFRRGDGDHYSMAEYRFHLLEQHADNPMKDLGPEPAQKGVLAWKMEQPSVQRLRNQLMLMAPEALDAEMFADIVIRDLLSASLVAYDERAANELLKSHGMVKHNRVGDPTMPLIAKAVDELPCWEYNGMSPKEYREKKGLV